MNFIVFIDTYDDPTLVQLTIADLLGVEFGDENVVVGYQRAS